MSLSYINFTEGTDAKMLAVTKTEASDTIKVQAVAQSLFDVTFIELTIDGTSQTSQTITCNGKPKVYFNFKFSDSSASASYRIGFTDNAGFLTYSDSFTVAATSITDPANTAVYMSELVTVDTLGIKNIVLYEVSGPSAGTVTIYVGAETGDA